MKNLSKCTLLIVLISPICMANTLVEELSICAKNTDDLQRLVCYDKLTKSAGNNKSTTVLAKPAKPASPAVQSLESRDYKEAKVTQQKVNFGLKNKQLNQVKQIQAKIVKVEKSVYGDQIISLDNGQVWRQTDNTRLKLKEDQLVSIKRGVLGSFFISKENTNKRIRAKRVK